MHDIINLLSRIRELETLLDISERKSDILTNLLKEASAEYDQTLEKIRISEKNFHTIFKNAPEGIYIIELVSRRIIDCNSFILKWLGYTRPEMLKMQVDDILDLETIQIKKNVANTIKNDRIKIQELCFIRKNGAFTDAEVTETKLDYNGKKCLVALIRDITERKKIEEFSKYKELFENVSDPVFINDINGYFLEVNDVCCECFGYTKKQFLQMHINELIVQNQHHLLTEMAASIQNGKSYQFELMMITKTENKIPFEFQGRYIDYNRKPAFISVGRNLSIRKKLEKNLIMNERLSAVGEMSSGVAHNFNNLLQIIMGAGEAAIGKLEKGQIQVCKDNIQNILKTSQRGADIVKRIKDFTLGRESIDEGIFFDLEKLVYEAVVLTQPIWKNPSAPQKYRFNHIKSNGCFAKGNPSEIYEVLVNLINNSIEAMPRGGVITISTEIVDKKIFLSISDTGDGISEEHIQHIFEPFFTTKGMKNSGLGLASCYGIIKKHHGEISVTSIPGQGARFTVILPLKEKKNNKIIKKEIVQQQENIKFLLIDDEINLLKAMNSYFIDTGVDIFTASNAMEGLKLFQRKDFDVILCDLSMNDMDGLELGKKIKDYCLEKEIPKIPFLLYTGINKPIEQKQLEISGVDQVINKPVKCRDLYNIILEIA